MFFATPPRQFSPVRRMAPLKKAWVCEDGGFVQLQSALILGSEIKCNVCKEFLEAYKFDRSAFRKVIDTHFCSDEDERRPHGEPEPRGDNLESEKEEKRKADARADFEKFRGDPWALMSSMKPIITLLPPGTANKALPFRCNICKSRRNPDGKLCDLVSGTWKSVYYFLHQHIDRPVHQGNLAAYVAESEGTSTRVVECEGLCIDDPLVGRCLYRYREEFKLWTEYANFKERGTKHVYWRLASEDVWFVRSSSCDKSCQYVEGRRHQVCERCFNLGDAKSIVRSPIKFAMKFAAAQLLCSRVFGSEVELAERLKEIESSALYKGFSKQMSTLIKLSTPKLQQYVRSSFLSDWKTGESLQRFLHCTVLPALKVNVGSVPESLHSVMTKFSLALRSGSLDPQDAAKLKVAAAAVKGSFDGHPLILGLALQCRRQCEKLSRGIQNMRGRRDDENEHERQLIQDAGIQLAAASGNTLMAKEFGLNSRAMKTKMSELKAHNLPVPALAMIWPEILKENFEVANMRYPMSSGAPKRHLPFS